MEISNRDKTDSHETNRVLIRNLVFVVVWAALFTLAYAQSPLYTSNQNQYFLHGFANAGVGSLSQDWLANTLDPTPVFSKMIELSWRAIPWRPVFYLYFGVLAGITLFSLLGIADLIWVLRRSQPKTWFFLASLTGLFSAGMRYLSARLLGVNWEFLFDGGVAGQRLLGTVLQPSTFGVLLLLSISLFIRGKRGWAIVCLVIAASMHPTYLLGAGILTAVYMGITFRETRSASAPLVLGLGALVGVTPIVWHSLATFGGSDPVSTAAARNILVSFRIPHHAIVSEWLDASVLVKLGFVVLGLVILYTTKNQATGETTEILTPAMKLFHIILWPAAAATSLTILQVLTESVTLALLFPWRLSTWLVPLCVGLIVGWGVHGAFERFRLERYPGWVIAISGAAAILFAVIGIAKSQLSTQERQNLDDRAVMAYVEAHKEPGDLYLIPLKMQDFRLETGAPAYIEFKSIPYKDTDVLEWRRRVNQTRKVYEQTRCKKLPEMAETEGISHIVLPVDHDATECEQTIPVYQDEFYGVFVIEGP